MTTAVAAGSAGFRRMVELRRAFHEHPELAFEEAHTASLIMDELTRLGVDHEYGGEGGAVVARLEGPNKNGATVALRAEMDGLPAEERTGLPFASKVPGRMHACGHDAHMAMVLGAAAAHVADPPTGNVVYVFQRPESMARAWAKACAELPPGGWLISLEFEVPGVPPSFGPQGGDGRPVWGYRLGRGPAADSTGAGRGR